MNREHAEQEVMRLADAWATAELRGDTTFLEKTLADDFIGIGPLGFMLTRQEWLAGVDFLTATGQKCDDERQEFILLSDVLGFSSLVDLINAADGATESTVLGPLYVPGAPVRAMGEQLGRPEDGSPTLVRGRVTDPAGEPLLRLRARRPACKPYPTKRVLAIRSNR